MKSLVLKCTGALLATLVTASGMAHHSFAMFADTQVTVTGTVKKLEWTNPHIWLWIDVTDDKGAVTTWGFEGSAPAEMLRAGWTKRSVAVGEKITVTGRPLKDGRPGGSMGSVTKADGARVGKAQGGYGGPPGGMGAGGPPPAGAPPAPAQ